MRSTVSRTSFDRHSNVAASGRRIVICGSVSFMHQMRMLKDALAAEDVPAVTPADLDFAFELGDSDAYLRFKRGTSLAHIRKIRDPRTFAVLVANYEKDDLYGYIGPSTFAEIGVAFSAHKQIYLLDRKPPNYADELASWGAVELFGDLSRLLRAYEETCRRATAQLRFPRF
jgi:hypothetical protein